VSDLSSSAHGHTGYFDRLVALQEKLVKHGHRIGNALEGGRLVLGGVGNKQRRTDGSELYINIPAHSR